MSKDVVRESKYRRKFLPYGANNRNSFLASVPWIDLIAIACFAIWIGRPAFLVPGMEVNLPEQEFSSGSAYSVSAIVSSIERGTNSMNIVFFNDKRFILNSKEQEIRLQDDMNTFNKVNPNQTLILFIDKDVRYGTVVDLMELSRNAGFKAVNMSTQTR